MEIDWGLQIWTLLTFAALFAVLAKFVFRPLRTFISRREETIRQSLEKAGQAHAEAERLAMENRLKLDQSRDETRRIIDEGHRIVGEMKREAEKRARLESQAIIEQARTEIDRQIQKSLDELKNTVASISVNISRRFIKENIDEKKHLALADEFVERLKQTNASRKT